MSENTTEMVLRFLFRRTIEKIESRAKKEGASQARIDVTVHNDGMVSDKRGLCQGDAVRIIKDITSFLGAKTVTMEVKFERTWLDI